MKPLVLAFLVFVNLCGLSALARAQSAAASAQDLWAAYKQRFVSDEGRLIDDSAEGVSHSEGQGYAMLLAAFSDDREGFAKLWAWTVANLEIRNDGLAAWRWRPGDDPHVKDRNNATDGDLLIAWALATAGERWSNPDYDAAAAKIAMAISGRLLHPAIFGLAIAPGANGFGPKDRKDGPVVNLSYWVFPAFAALARVAPEVDWAGLKQSGLALLDAAKFGPRKLPSDWISLKYGVQPAAGFPARFGYDALRAPLYLAWGAPQERVRLSALIDAWAGAEDKAPDVIELDSGDAKETLGDPGYRAVAALARCVAHDVAFPAELTSVPFDRYYPATLHMLALTALREGRFSC